MKNTLATTDATWIYRDTSALSAVRTDFTGDTGSLLQVVRDSVVVIGPTTNPNYQGKIPEYPNGTIEAVGFSQATK